MLGTLKLIERHRWRWIYVTWIHGQSDHHRILDRYIVLVPTVDTYVEWGCIEHFSANKYQNFEETGRTLWNIIVPSNPLKGLPSSLWMSSNLRSCTLNWAWSRRLSIVSSFSTKSLFLDHYFKSICETTLLWKKIALVQSSYNSSEYLRVSEYEVIPKYSSKFIQI